MRSGEQTPQPRRRRRGLDTWWREHDELDRRFGELFGIIAGRRPAAASAAFEELAEALEAHLGVEEDVYFPLIESLAPAHVPSLHKARLAHIALRAQLDQMRARLADGALEPARELLGRIRDELLAHERAEARLIAELTD